MKGFVIVTIIFSFTVLSASADLASTLDTCLDALKVSGSSAVSDQFASWEAGADGQVVQNASNALVAKIVDALNCVKSSPVKGASQTVLGTVRYESVMRFTRDTRDIRDDCISNSEDFFTCLKTGVVGEVQVIVNYIRNYLLMKLSLA